MQLLHAKAVSSQVSTKVNNRGMATCFRPARQVILQCDTSNAALAGSKAALLAPCAVSRRA